LIRVDIRSTSLLQNLFLGQICNPGEDILECNSNCSILSVSALPAITLDTILLGEQIQSALPKSISFCDSEFVSGSPPVSMMASWDRRTMAILLALPRLVQMPGWDKHLTAMQTTELDRIRFSWLSRRT
jgi:hypothetical protein